MRGLVGEEPDQCPAQGHPPRQANHNFAPVPHQLAAPPAPVKLFDVCCNNHWLSPPRSKEVPHLCYSFAILFIGSLAQNLSGSNGEAGLVWPDALSGLVNGASRIK